MKITSSKVVRRTVNTAIIPINIGITTVNVVIGIVPLVWTALRFVAGTPAWLLARRKEFHGTGLYQFTDRKGRKFNTLLQDSVAQTAIVDANAHGARQIVLDVLHREIAVDTRCPDFEAPHAIYQWSHPVFGFKGIERLRDAKPSERQSYRRLVRDALDGYAEYGRRL